MVADILIIDTVVMGSDLGANLTKALVLRRPLRLRLYRSSYYNYPARQNNAYVLISMYLLSKKGHSFLLPKFPLSDISFGKQTFIPYILNLPRLKASLPPS